MGHVKLLNPWTEITNDGEPQEHQQHGQNLWGKGAPHFVQDNLHASYEELGHERHNRCHEGFPQAYPGIQGPLFQTGTLRVCTTKE
jgi:hypothetical protein